MTTTIPRRRPADDRADRRRLREALVHGAVLLGAVGLLPSCTDAAKPSAGLEVRLSAASAAGGARIDQVRLLLFHEEGGARHRFPEGGDPPGLLVEVPVGLDLSRKVLTHVVDYEGQTLPADAQWISLIANGFASGQLVARSEHALDLRERRSVAVKLLALPEGCDADGDTFVACSVPGCCELAASPVNDCDPQSSDVHPWRVEDPCEHCGDGIDQDCDGYDAECVDEDDDGYPDCQEPAGCVGASPPAWPGKAESCNGADDDCDGQTDEGFQAFTGGVGAGVGEPCGRGTCAGGTVTCSSDGLRAVCSSAGQAASTDACGNDLDDDCDGRTDEGCSPDDLDGDGFVSADGDCNDFDSAFFPGAPEPCCPAAFSGRAETVTLCDRDCDGSVNAFCPAGDLDGDGFAPPEDCDEADPLVHPGAPEKCGDGKDQDCADGDVSCDLVLDWDGDGWSPPADCDDDDAAVSPEAAEVCDAQDNDCDGPVDEGNPDTGGSTACGIDTGACSKGTQVCVNATGETSAGEAFSPGSVICWGSVGASPEACDGVDNDCDGGTDEGCGTLQDVDGDGYTEETGDCAPFDAGIHPGAAEPCCPATLSGDPGAIALCDRNCDGAVDAFCSGADTDGDGHDPPDDCDDTDPLTYPGAPEKCGDGKDQDCVGGDVSCADVIDVDGDGWSPPADCDDDNPAAGLDAEEVCDGVDNDCDGAVDDGNPGTDGGAVCGEGKGKCKAGKLVCVGLSGLGPNGLPLEAGTVTCWGEVKPSKELCNGIDDSCDGVTDEGCVVVEDADGDGAPDEEDCAPFDAGIRPGAPEPCCPAALKADPGAVTLCDRNCDLAVDAFCSPDDLDGDGYAPPTDCDDGDPLTYPGAPEKCGDGKDQDCKAGDLPCAEAVDEDGDGWSPPADCDDGNAAIYLGAVEVCDGVDNDCDGVADDGNPGTGGGAPCGTDEGPCKVGKGVCVGSSGLGPNGLPVEAGTVVCWGEVPPKAELCNTVDDDCDGETDEGFTLGGLPLGAACDGPDDDACPLGTVVCGTGASTGPVCAEAAGASNAELCDGVDNDCDGETDEDFAPGGTVTFDGGPHAGDAGKALGDACGAGACAGGTVVCAPDNATSLACSSGDAASDDLCSGLDEDCDGETDEDFAPGGTVTFDGGPHVGDAGKALGDVCGAGACAGGTVICDPDDATSLDCSSGDVASDELCTGLDEDCDGETDEGYLYQGLDLGAGCDGVGACGAGQVECLPDGTAAVCSTNPAGSAAADGPETCNGLDDDCDGTTDEELVVTTIDGDVLTGTSCSAQGVCGTASGGSPLAVATCRVDPPTVAEAGWDCDYSAIPTHEAGSEASCDGLDNDCDGLTDDEFSIDSGCDGDDPDECANGTIACDPTDAGTTICDETEGATVAELCDGLDNDCDGETDEDFLAGGTITYTDLDGTTGLVLGVDCGTGACAGGQVICVPGNPSALACSTSANAVQEACDGVDNDCDGETDEDYDVGAACGIGQCASGMKECLADATGTRCDTMPSGASQAEAGSQDASTLETCDNVDNDCDGATDEDLTSVAAAGCLAEGACAEDGQTTALCAAGQWTCSYNSPGYQADHELGLCDGRDNDCDGETDEDFLAGGTITYTDLDGTTGLVLGAGCGSGACVGGEVICAPGDPSTMACSTSADAVSDTCDGLDNDCDGETDEDYKAGGTITYGGGPFATDAGTSWGDPCGAGACAGGTVECDPADPSALTCSSLVAATAEVCDGDDNDCNGVADDPFSDGTWPLTDAAFPGDDGKSKGDTCGTGACGAGSVVCDPLDPSRLICSVDLDAMAEACNAVDDDCDGATDENYKAGGDAPYVEVFPPNADRFLGQGCGTGACDGGVVVCAYDVAACSQEAPTAVDASCDGFDDDCDGVTDEDYAPEATTCGTGACAAAGITSCAAGAVQDSCTPLDPLSADDGTCDGVDDDCDGETDEDCCGALGVPCPGGFACGEDGWCVSSLGSEVYVPPGPFAMGCNIELDGACQPDESPQHMVDVPPFAIDRYEVTAAEYKAWCPGGACLPSTTGGVYGTYGAAAKQDHPINYVDWSRSRDYCEGQGKRLCTEAEWEKAARGGCELYCPPGDDACCNESMPTYPWGQDTPTCSTAVLEEGGGGCGTNSTFAVGSKKPGASPYGAMDMAGNVWEWAQDCYHGDYWGAPPDGSPWKDDAADEQCDGPYRVIRGGGFFSAPAYLRAAYRASPGSPATTAHDSLGIRCCRSIDPTCVPDCTGKSCGDDGCGGKCGACTAEESCSTDGQCLCGGLGAPCAGGTSCEGGACVSPDGLEVYVPEGRFWMGCNSALDGLCSSVANENPQHPVDVPGFFVDRYEVTAGAYKAWCPAGACLPVNTGGAVGTYDPPQKQEHPINYVDWSSSRDYCAAQGKRLCVEAEWEKAARGGCELYCPPGDDACCKAAMPTRPWGEAPPTCSLAAFDGCGNQTVAVTILPDGSSSALGASPYGALHMAGNVHEWVRDCYHGTYAGAPEDGSVWVDIPADDQCAGPGRTARGGGIFFVTDSLRIAGRTPVESDFNQPNSGGQVGFRCCRDYDPACVPDCTGKSCGDDGCGGKCGACTADESCSADGQCLCGDLGAPCGGGSSCEGGACVSPDGLEVYVPAGSFAMGCNAVMDGACQARESPQHMVDVPGFFIDRYEVTAAAYKAWCPSGACAPSVTGGVFGTFDPPAKQDHPINYVTWFQARDYCAAQAKQLCTEAEWEKAARGGCELYCPTGDDACCEGAMPTYPWGEAAATCEYAVMDHGGDGCGTASTSAVGSKPAGASPYGALDMAGNLWEWVRDCYHTSYWGAPTDGSAWKDEATDEQCDSSGRAERGGSFQDFAPDQRAGYRTVFGPGFARENLGFRCCRELDPLAPCVPDCTGKSCGDDGCGGKCGVCAAEESCSADGQCVCGGLGANCAAGTTCLDGVCLSNDGQEVYVPAGSFWMGCNEALNSGCTPQTYPQHEVAVPAFSIDRHEVTAAEYKAWCPSGDCLPSPINGTYGTYAAAEKQDHPINYVTWYQARDYCEGRGQRLCSEAEWEKAARGGCQLYCPPGGDACCQASMPTYPWGETPPDCSLAATGACSGDTVGVQELPDGSDAAPGASPYGAYHMSGNVMEWVEDCYHASYIGAPDDGSAWLDSEPGTGCASSERVVRSGSFAYLIPAWSAGHRYHFSAPASDGALGFRCCRELDPVAPCVPDCAGKTCGDEDGCGGTCSGCPSGETCSESGECECGTLGTACAQGTTCQDGTCLSTDGTEVYVPAGTFWMGCNDHLDGNCEANEEPQHEVDVPPFAIDRYEVTTAEYKAWCATSACVPSMTAGEFGTFDVPQKQELPINFVTWFQAADYCAAQGQRLCTEAEWEKAARGGCELYCPPSDDSCCKAAPRTFPWGELDPTCEVAIFNDEVQVPGCGANHMAPVGSAPAGRSPYGAEDLAGNAYEWVRDCYHPTYGGAPGDGSAWTDDPSDGQCTNSLRIMRGGGFFTTANDLRASRRVTLAPGDDLDGLTIRCCRSLDPAAPCLPDCTQKTCGDDGCGGSCGGCPAGETCSVDNACVCGALGATCAGGTSCEGGACISPDGLEVFVPGGRFWMGCNAALDASCTSVEAPQHAVDVPGFFADRYEATAASYKAWCPSGDCLPTTTAGEFGTYDSPAKQDHPINYINWYESRDYCEGQGKRLCTESEWEKTARGGCELYCPPGDDECCKASMPTYPWGEESATCSLAAFSECPGGTVSVTALPDGSDATAGASPYGAVHMGGNVWEWVQDCYHSDYSAAPADGSPWKDTEADDQCTSTDRTRRGGGISHIGVDLRAGFRSYGPPDIDLLFLGTRCCRDYDPSCVPDCTGKSCGDDGCGGKCGACTAEESCSTDGQCLCGDLGAPCAGGTSCEGGACVSPDGLEVYVPEGRFWMGCNSALDGPCSSVANENPQHPVDVPGFFIDRYEVTAAAYKAWCPSGGCLPSTTGGTHGTFDPPAKQDHPINYVTWFQARDYCAAQAKRLCTEAEWEKAARGGCNLYCAPGDDACCKASMPTYPWGEDAPTCSLAQVSIECGVNTVAVTQLFDGADAAPGASPYGAYHMAGNVWEWVRDCYHGSYSGAPTDGSAWKDDAVDDQCDSSGRVVRGGGFYFIMAADVRAGRRGGVDPGNGFFPTQGFRCCRSAP